MTDSVNGPLARWNRRRQLVQAEAEAESLAKQTGVHAPAHDESVPTNAADQLAAEQGAPEAHAAAERWLSAEDLPDPDTIAVGGSFASFMAENVDPKVKTAALRALWKQPHYHEIDGLLEYALDYTDQPKLTSEMSLELAKKVFRHLTKDEAQGETDANSDTGATGGEACQMAGLNVADSATSQVEEIAERDGTLQGAVTVPRG